MEVESMRPSWYDALQDKPLASASFNDELATRIRQKAQSLEFRRGSPRTRGVVCGTACLLLCLFVFFIYSKTAFRLDPVTLKGVYTVEAESGQPIIFSMDINAGGALLIAEQGTSRVSYYIPQDKQGIKTGEGFVAGSAGIEAIPILMGEVLSPDIARIQITDNENQSFQARIVAHADKRYWFATQPNRKERALWYKVVAIGASGDTVGEEVLF
jgi:hypothetical protein